MAESDAFARRGHLGGAAGTTLASGITAASATITVVDGSTWAGIATDGPYRFTINEGGATEEECEATGISGNDLTGVTRGVGGTTAAAHVSGESVEHTSSVRDFAEANELVSKILGIPSLAAGDLLYFTAATVLARLAKGTARQQLAMNSGATAPEWVASLQSLLTTTGDIIIASAANTPARLAAGTSGYVLTSGGAGVAPSWAAGTSLSAKTATVATSETTTSSTFTDLSTAGPAVTDVTVGASGLMLVTVTSRLSGSAEGSTCVVGFAISGASTVAASEDRCLRYWSPANGADDHFSATFLISGLTPGLHTVTAKYLMSGGGGTGTFSKRSIHVIGM